MTAAKKLNYFAPGRNSIAGAALILAGAVAAFAQDPAPRPGPPAGVPRALPPSSNPTDDARVELGRKLFADTRLSANGKVSCATCHVATLAMCDGRATAIGVTGKPLARNAPSVLNAGLLPSFFWDGRAETLEEQARMPFLNADEMGMDEEKLLDVVAKLPEYGVFFEKAYGDRIVTLQRMARAIAAFERTLVSGDAPFDRWWRGDAKAMSEPAQRGYALFVDRAGCAQCHSLRQSYALFTDLRFHATGAGKGAGLTDPGRFAVTKRPEDKHAFRTPSLRNVELTKPYMHDGSLATLEDVVDFYVEGGGEIENRSKLMHPLNLDVQERADLVAFLKALTSHALPQLEECDKLLAAGRPKDAFEAFKRELDERGGGDRALTGLVNAAIVMSDADALNEADRRLRKRLSEVTPDGSKDGLEPATGHLARLGVVSMGLGAEDDALIAWGRVRKAVGLRDDTAALEVTLLERRGRADDALVLLADAKTPVLRALRAKVQYRRGWRGFVAKKPSDRDRADLKDAASQFDALLAERAPLDDEAIIFRATARHWVGEIDAARTAYLEAAARESSSEKALRALRSLLAKDLPKYRADLAALREAHPDSPAIVFFSAYEDFEQGRLDEAERGMKRRIEIEPFASAGPHVYLARIAMKRGQRSAALAQYAVAAALDPKYTGLLTEYEGILRAHKVQGWDDVDAVVAEYDTFLDAGPDDASFQIRVRNNLAFTLRDVAAAWTSRGPARLHTFAEGAPAKAKETLRKSLALYEASAALVPEDVSDLTFKERWDYAGVLNDLGLMLHYFPEIQDLPRAEKCYLRAFEMTEGQYQDSYFYNLQFLYAFELPGREKQWWELAKVAKDAILKEDPQSPSGFSPDMMKRTAARRDFERLSSELGR